MLCNHKLLQLVPTLETKLQGTSNFPSLHAPVLKTDFLVI